MGNYDSAEILQALAMNDFLISFEKAVPAGHLKKDFISLAAHDGRAIGLTTSAGFLSSYVELPRAMFDDFVREGLIEQDRPEDADGRIFFRLTIEGRARATS